MADACATLTDVKDCESHGCVPAKGSAAAGSGPVCQDAPAHCAVLDGTRCMRCHDPYVIDSDGAQCEFQLPTYVPLALGGVGLLLLIVSEIAHHRNNNERAHHRERVLEQEVLRMEMNRPQPAMPSVIYAPPPAPPAAVMNPARRQ